jgi:hypothetical protein
MVERARTRLFVNGCTTVPLLIMVMKFARLGLFGTERERLAVGLKLARIGQSSGIKKNRPRAISTM